MRDLNLVHFAHNWNNGILEGWDIGFFVSSHLKELGSIKTSMENRQN
jgi:hypothetical protein